MKKFIFCAIVVLNTISAFSQTDIKDIFFRNPSEIIAMYGEPVIKDKGFEYPASLTLAYDDCVIAYDTDEDDVYCPCSFIFYTDRFCILSDYIDGGIKIGDSLEKLLAFDFPATEYGQGKMENKLKKIASMQYMAYSEEYFRFYFNIEDNRIVLIQFGSIEDASGHDYANPKNPLGKGTPNRPQFVERENDDEDGGAVSAEVEEVEEELP
ncbi:MAG: hypothetical protein IK143_03490 [Bacteroidales bacterium]|nr:hypothetical protein [Bacteroidales bacterium]